MCKIPDTQVQLFQTGYSCCYNSKQNPQRFQQDIVENPHAIHQQSFEAALNYIKEKRLLLSILENTEGLQCRSSTSGCRM